MEMTIFSYIFDLVSLGMHPVSNEYAMGHTASEPIFFSSCTNRNTGVNGNPIKERSSSNITGGIT